MKALFMTPPYKFKELASLKFDVKTDILPPLGILYISAVLEKYKHKVKILDLALQNYPYSQLYQIIKKFNPDIICLTTTTPTANNTYKLAKFLKTIIKVPIILGGPHASCFPSKILENHNELDIIAVGEGDYTVKEILDCIKKKKSLKNVKGIYYKNKNKIIKTKQRNLIKNLDELPLPARHLVNIKKYQPLPNQYKRLPLTNMITSRGCPYHCTFCFESGKLGHKYRRHSPKRIIQEIKELINKYNIKEIAFYDDNFVTNQDWVYEFCSTLIKEKIDIVWSCYARVNHVSKDLLNKMAKAGCWNVFYGIESGNQFLLNKIKKGITLQQSKNAVKWAKEAGIEVRGALIVGLPGETPKLAEEAINFAIDLDLDYAQFAYATPFNGTEFYKQCSKEGKILTNNFSKYNFNEPVFLPKGYKNTKQLKKIFKRAYTKFYLRPKYILKHIKKIKSFRDIKKYFTGIKLALNYTILR